ncbi:MAG: hypothetical protein GX589_11150 [Deltaproteobacteria bacterium]|nr:hypothetical protein [Deltaproteobacteria bacterium]
MVEVVNKNIRSFAGQCDHAQRRVDSERAPTESLFSDRQLSVALNRLKTDLQPQALQRVQGVLSHVAEKEPLIKGFWEKLVLYHQFGYTLFGSKPISSGELLGGGIAHANEEDRRINEKYFITLKEQRAWQELARHLFSSKFILVATKSPDRIGRCELNLVNKKALRRVINDAKECFRPVLGQQPAETLMERLAMAQPLYQALEGRLDLTGIVLGYGKNNSLLYQRREELNREKMSGRIHETFASQGFTTAQHGLERIRELLVPQASTQAWGVHPVKFNGLNSCAETTELKAYYSKVQDELNHWINSSDSFLERILARFISDQDD